MSESAAQPAVAEVSHPIRMVVTDDLQRSRLTVFFRFLLLIPHLIWLSVWSISVFLLAIVAWVICLVTGWLPGGVHSFFTVYLRYVTHVNAYAWLLAEPFPKFLGDTGYPVDLDVDGPERQGRLGVLFRLILAIPALLVVNVLQSVAWVLAVIAWFYALATGRASAGIRDLGAYCLRFQQQTYAYLLFLTSRYPSFAWEG